MSVISDFIRRWSASGGSEQANAQMFLAELCDILEVPRPEPAKPLNEENTYSFERKVYLPRGDGTSELKRLDLYRKGHFVLESKQGQETSANIPDGTKSSAAKRGTRQWEDTMQRAKRQAENYIRCLPAPEGRPPFIIVADIGYCFDLYAEFSCSGGVYLPFPDVRRQRIFLPDLEKEEVRDLLRNIWRNPLILDPARHSAKVTEEVAAHLAQLARLLESDGHSAERVSQFLLRCIFSMFSEDVGLIPAGCFKDILQKSVMDAQLFEGLVNDLWVAMNSGGISVLLQRKLLRFNGSLFAAPEVLPLKMEQIGILLEAAKANWKEVEPAIFGTLLERALNPKERHKLGAHYTPRAYVERLVLPTVMQPLRAEWDAVQASANLLANQSKMKAALKTLQDFHKRLRKIRVLDPACGSGNFLYVTLEHMKRLEAEVLKTLTSYGDDQHSMLEVDPQQFLGLEVNTRAAHIAEMVLWIGHLQWHFRTHGNVPPQEPVIKKFENIQCRDALLTWKSWEYASDENGKPITRWDGETYKIDPTTGRQVPDEKAVVVDKVYQGIAEAKWPDADFIVGNPPFIGGSLKRKALGDGYFDALTKTFKELPESCDFVMYWWHKAAKLVATGQSQRFGFITTNSISQTFNRRVLALHLNTKKPLYLTYAIPDHPWVDAADGAAVRIAMTVAAKGHGKGTLASLINEEKTSERERKVTLQENEGTIFADLRQGVNVTAVEGLAANRELCSQGMKLHGNGFIVSLEQATKLGLGRISGLQSHIRPFMNGRDITEQPRNVLAIDLFGLSLEEINTLYPDVYQWLYTNVKPERDLNNRKAYKDNWWIFGEPRKELRPAIHNITRYIATVRVSKHRFFIFLDADIIPESRLMAIALEDAYYLGVLSSRVHVLWSFTAGAAHGVGHDPTYNNTLCFDPFPFPAPTSAQQAHIRDLGERLDAHRKARQELYPKLTMTGMYNVLEGLREGRELTDKERVIHEQGLVTVLRELHDELDAAVADAYGWPADLPDEEILERLVALNAERAAEEKNGQVRWLRPEYQTKSKAERMQQATLDIPNLPTGKAKGRTAGKGKTAQKPASKKTTKQSWPSDLLEQTQAVRSVIENMISVGGSIGINAVATHFSRANKDRIKEILNALATLGFVTFNPDE